MLFLGFATWSAFAGVLYVQSVSTKMMSERSFKSKPITDLKRGDKLESSKSEGGWYKVKSGSFEGWVHRLSVSRNRPMAKISLVTQASPKIGNKARKRASAITSAAAARGLSDSDRKRTSDRDKPEFGKLKNLEDSAGEISDSEVVHFIHTK